IPHLFMTSNCVYRSAAEFEEITFHHGILIVIAKSLIMGQCVLNMGCFSLWVISSRLFSSVEDGSEGVGEAVDLLVRLLRLQIQVAQLEPVIRSRSVGDVRGGYGVYGLALAQVLDAEESLVVAAVVDAHVGFHALVIHTSCDGEGSLAVRVHRREQRVRQRTSVVVEELDLCLGKGVLAAGKDSSYSHRLNGRRELADG
ncbi:hypothetical protein PFISCL1PPCAC_13107, partial [Pristionchus fissidentatus]